MAEYIIPIIYGISAVASTAGAVVSYQQAQTAAKQTEYNAQAQADAIAAEQKRKAAEMAENQRRLALQGRRERATQLAAQVESGFVTSTGTPLAIMADTIVAQSRRMGDYSTEAGLAQARLGAQGSTILQEGRSQAGMMRSQAGASLVSGLAGAATSFAGSMSNRPGTATTPNTYDYKTRQPMTGTNYR